MSSNWAGIQPRRVTLDHDACALPSGRAQDAASREWHNLPLEEPLQRISWRGRRITSPRVGSQAADGRFVTSSQQRRGDQRASSFAEPADVFKPNAAPRVVVNPVTLAVMWPKRGCRSGPPLPAYGVSIPTLLHASTRGKFSSAGWSRIQVGGDSAPPWTGDGDALEKLNPAGAAGAGCGREGALLRPEKSD